ncbi:nucleotidyltransferase domain-containing protein [Salana multivorans]
MSYARFLEGDVYVLMSRDGLECCGCFLQEREWVEDEGAFFGGYLKPVGEIVPTTFTSTWDMVAHLRRHRNEGHHVPGGIEAELWRDDAENFPRAERDSVASPLPPGGVEYGDRHVALRGEILRTVVGSGVHGIAIEGTDDHDELGVYIEPREWVLGPVRHRQDLIWRSQPEGARSGPGDTDLVMYSLAKYLRLALKGNPTVLLPLFAPEESVLRSTPFGDELRRMRSAFLSREAIERFLGYAQAQHERMLGRSRRGVPSRPELVARHGWDVKYGSHALRLAYQGRELATIGTLTLPMPPAERDRVLAVKRGEVPRDEVSTEIEGLLREVRRLLDEDRTSLPESPDLARITRFAIDARQGFWALSP